MESVAAGRECRDLAGTGPERAVQVAGGVVSQAVFPLQAAGIGLVPVAASGVWRVWEARSGARSPASTARLTACTAMDRYVVHLPPATVNRPAGLNSSR